MAATGTVTQVFSSNGALITTLAGVTTASTSQVFGIKDYTMSSFVISGTYGAGASLQWQGSNDGGTTWVNVGPALVSTSIQGGTITPNGMFYRLYQLAITSGDGTTSIAAVIAAVIPR